MKTETRSQPPVKPGQKFTYEFVAKNPGTHMYHSHINAMKQVGSGMLGAFIIEPKDTSSYPKYDKEYTMVLNDTLLGFTINGKGFPATEALTAKQGERLLIRFMNEGNMNHPMHLHGVPMQVYARDGYPLPQPYLCDTLDVAFFAAYGPYPNLATAQLIREQIFAALPQDHHLAAQDTICWRDLRDEAILVQDWEDSHATREFYASLIGIGLPLRSHPASKQSVLALVAAGFGMTLVLESQAQVTVPGVSYRQILEENAYIDIVLAWAPEAEDATIGRFVSFMRDHAPLSRGDR